MKQLLTCLEKVEDSNGIFILGRTAIELVTQQLSNVAVSVASGQDILRIATQNQQSLSSDTLEDSTLAEINGQVEELEQLQNILTEVHKRLSSERFPLLLYCECIRLSHCHD